MYEVHIHVIDTPPICRSKFHYSHQAQTLVSAINDAQYEPGEARVVACIVDVPAPTKPAPVAATNASDDEIAGDTFAEDEVEQARRAL